MLLAKRDAKASERDDVLSKLSDVANQSDGKKAEMDNLVARKATVVAEFDALVAEQEAFKEPLAKIFYRYRMLTA